MVVLTSYTEADLLDVSVVVATVIDSYVMIGSFISYVGIRQTILQQTSVPLNSFRLHLMSDQTASVVKIDHRNDFRSVVGNRKRSTLMDLILVWLRYDLTIYTLRLPMIYIYIYVCVCVCVCGCVSHYGCRYVMYVW